MDTPRPHRSFASSSAPSKPCSGIRKFLALALLCLACLAPLPILSAGEITGVLGSFRDEEGGSYFGVAVDRSLVWKSPDGQVVKAEFPQLAGLDREAYAEAELWTGRRVRITGRPMERHTRHHAMPVLWLAEKVILEDYDGTKGAGDGFVLLRAEGVGAKGGAGSTELGGGAAGTQCAQCSGGSL